ncbi:LuxR C-terminal-related transcriptional regulator [Streptomyces sp. NPDC050095]|uniref:helix-turn-helix transcriptional regulator n=1 Tax=unclassified Streptomyces TaxID=2593676 RepID=UPI00343C7D6E
MSREAAAQQLRTATAAIIEAYRAGLGRLGSPLVSREDIWRQCRHQAQNIVAECAQALEAGKYAEPPGVGEYTRLLGAHRVVQQVPVSESVRAVEVLWQAMQGAIGQAVAAVRPEERLAATQTVGAAFRASTGSRLYQGIRGYEEARQPLGQPLAAETAERSAEAPAHEQVLDLLTLRERQILEAVRDGLTNRLIGRRLEISEATVKRHLHNAYRKLGASSRVQALNKAFPAGI